MVCIIMGIVATPSADTQVTMGHDQAAFEKRWSLYTGGLCIQVVTRTGFTV